MTKRIGQPDNLRVRVGFGYSNELRTRGSYKIGIFDGDREAMSASSKETSDEYYADNNKAIEAAEALAKKLNIPLDLNGFFRYDNPHPGKVRDWGRDASGGIDGDVLGGIAMIVIVVLGIAYGISTFF